jgi:cbb3-type cytochrome oxidase subunit 3
MTALWIILFFLGMLAMAYGLKRIGKKAANEANDFNQKMKDLEEYLQEWTVCEATFYELKLRLEEIGQHPGRDRERIVKFTMDFYLKYKEQARNKYVKKN